MSSARINYSPSAHATSETETSALINVYKFVLDCHAKKKAAPESRPDDARKDQDAGTYSYCT
jgi:hypothetical protein